MYEILLDQSSSSAVLPLESSLLLEIKAPTEQANHSFKTYSASVLSSKEDSDSSSDDSESIVFTLRELALRAEIRDDLVAYI